MTHYTDDAKTNVLLLLLEPGLLPVFPMGPLPELMQAQAASPGAAPARRMGLRTG